MYKVLLKLGTYLFIRLKSKGPALSYLMCDINFVGAGKEKISNPLY